MKIKTTRFGEVEIDKLEIIHFPEGVPGFSHLKRFVILDHPNGGPFCWLQAVDDPALAFVILDPLIFRPDYCATVTAEDAKALELEEPSDAVVYCICGIRENPEEMTANLRAPIVINIKKRIGKQIILQDETYKTRHYILKEMREYAKRVKERKDMAQLSSDEGKEAK